MYKNWKLLILVLSCATTVALIGAHKAEPAAKATTPSPEATAMCELIAVHKQVPSPTPTPVPTPVEPVLPYDVPLSADVQEFLLAECEAEGVPPDLVIAIIGAESNFEADAVNEVTHDYGLMQINQGNHAWLSEELGITDFLDPKQNIKAGVFVLGELCKKYDSLNDTLMAYNLGPSGAARQQAQGVTSTAYSRKILAAVEDLEAIKKCGRNWKLTPEQQDFATEHHDRIVLGFLRRKKLNHDDEYYTVVIYQYLYSVKIYLERPELRKWTFQAIAWRNMSGAVYRYWQKENRLPTCRLDEVQPQTEQPRLEKVASADDVPAEVEYRKLVRWILALEKMERKVSA